MLRATVLLALLANALLWAFGQGWLAPLGWSLPDHREPWRTQQQIAPEGLRLLNTPGSPGAADEPPAPAPSPD